MFARASRFTESRGLGLLESIYEEALVTSFTYKTFHAQRQVNIEVRYKGIVIKGQRLDLLVRDEVISELKSISELPDVAMAQMLSSLKVTGLKRGLIVNFGEKRLVDGIKRVSL